MRCACGAVLGAAVLSLVTACGAESKPGLEPGAGSAGKGQAAGGVVGVMRAKQGPAQSIMAGLARADYDLVHENALRLYRLSQETQWNAHDTVTYILYSDQFRQVAWDLAGHARQRDLDAMTADYLELTRTCVECHAYLRREKLVTDFPERVSRAEPGDPPAATP